MNSLRGHIYQGVPGFYYELENELAETKKSGRILSQDPLLVWVETPDEDGPFWVRNVWLNPAQIQFDSVSEAAAALRAMGRNWSPALFTCFRRGALIQERLPRLPAKPKPFPWTVPDAPMGSWTLLDEHTLIAASRCSSPFPGGVIRFEENKTEAPSRAYLKLWEALALAGTHPGPGDRCIDAGASPGGWTWALSGLGATVLAIDRSPLDSRMLQRPGVSYRQHDAFTLTPRELGEAAWVFSDVICYPPRLYRWIASWLESGLCSNFICTIKMQGRSDNETARRFAAVPGSRIVQLCHNKHELTWIKAPPC
jgi:23S rRNA (cytidine2498-2'-O)-methyltransferase